MILYGKPVAEKIYQTLEKKIEKLSVLKKPVFLAIVLVGEDPASLTYIKVKEKIARRLKINYRIFHLPAIVSQKGVEKVLDDLAENKNISGIIVQLPLPVKFNTEAILKKIPPEKDIDGFSGSFPAPTAQAILEMLNFYHVSLVNKQIAILGYGQLVGRPLEKMFIRRGLKPKICVRKTKKIKTILLEADIIIAAAGSPGLIKPGMVNRQAIIIDAGTSEDKGGGLVGDLDPKTYSKIRAYSPVPGGVGPVTVACLIRNLIKAAGSN